VDIGVRGSNQVARQDVAAGLCDRDGVIRRRVADGRDADLRGSVVKLELPIAGLGTRGKHEQSEQD